MDYYDFITTLMFATHLGRVDIHFSKARKRKTEQSIFIPNENFMIVTAMEILSTIMYDACMCELFFLNLIQQDLLLKNIILNMCLNI